MNHKPDNPPGLSYRDAGVDIDAGNALVDRIRPAVKSTNREGVVTGLGGFGGLFRLDASKYEDPILVSGTDGVGTKLLLARQLRRHDTIGTDLVAMCVNDILTCGAEPLFFLDYYATGKLELDEAQAVIEGIADGCRQAGCALIGGETAEMPGMYGIGEYDLAGFAVGAVDRPKLIDGSAVAEGHVVLGLASSGPHSNGYSLIRKVLETSACDPATPLGEATLGEVLLAPTRIYVKALLPLLEHHSIDGLAHITGGGLDENVIRIVPDGLGLEIDLAAWQWPAVFDWLQTSGHIGENEMLRTFNCGIGMAILVPADEAGPVTNALEAAGEAVYRIGRVIATNDEQRVRFIRS